MSVAAVARHSLVHLHPAGWREALATRRDLDALPILTGWAERGWPLVARRIDADDPAGAVALGLPLPPSLGKRRLRFAVAPGMIAAVAQPLPLHALASAPARWRPTLDALVDLGRRCGAEPRAFGSFAWQELTGLAYVSETSDLDVLWPPTPAAAALLAALPLIEAAAPGRLDGELLDGAGRAAQGRELGGGEVMMKSLHGVALVAAAEFLGGVAA